MPSFMKTVFSVTLILVGIFWVTSRFHHLLSNNFGRVGHTQILWTRRYDIPSVEGMCKLNFHSFWYHVHQTTWWWFFQTYERWQTWFQSSSLTTMKLLKTSEGNHYCASSQKFFMCFPFFRPKTLSSVKWLCRVCRVYYHSNILQRAWKKF